MKKIQFVFLVLISFNSAIAQYKATEWNERDKWQKTSDILKHLDLQPSMNVADIGCHEGYLTMKISPLVPDGKVYAVDIEKYKLNKLNKRLKGESITNVLTIHGAPDDPKLPKGQLDRVVILDTYHEIEDYQEVLRHIYSALKSSGKLVLIEPIAKNRRSWTREKQADKHEISLKYVVEDLNQAGFIINTKIDPFIERLSKSDDMWLIVATKSTEN